MGVNRDVSTAYCWSSSGDDVDWLCLIVSSTVAVGDWCISVLAVVVNDWGILFLFILTRRCFLDVIRARFYARASGLCSL